MSNFKDTYRYSTPEIENISLSSEGILCSSSSHDPFEIDNSWKDILMNEN